MKIIKENLTEKEGIKNLYKEKSGGWFLGRDFLDEYTKKISEASEFIKKTREIRLLDLGRFPLEEQNESLLSEEVSFQEMQLLVPEILKQSKIPVFYSKTQNEGVFISKEAMPICRYFFHSWGFDTEDFNLLNETTSEEKETIIGFFIIHSFTGGEIK
ncbi:MAG: hypothetical protein OEZ13_04890 [Spirochaetia bacterium]|nr:hypothetical protein [Spirochaetia bacterium]